MWTFLRTPRRRATQPHVWLRLESLDQRLSPSSLLDPTADALDPSGSDTQYLVAAQQDVGQTSDLVSTANVGPTIANFKGVEVVGGLWRFTGDVIDPAPGGLTVTFGGEPVSLRNVKTPTDANGHFDKSVLMKTNGSDNGLASAQTVDGAGRVSNLALCNISPG